jgi:hypothetical protein
LYIGTHRQELDILAVFVNTVAEDLLTLFVDIVNVIDNNRLFLPQNTRRRLTKCLEFVAKKLDALFFQVVDDHDVVLGESVGFRESIIFANNGVNERGFAGTGVADEEDVGIVDFNERFQYSYMLRV